MDMKKFLLPALWFFSQILLPAYSQDTNYLPLVTKSYELSRKCEQIPGPESPEEFSAWLSDIKHWRKERLIRMGFQAHDYSRPEFKWTQKCFIQTLLLVTDRYFYDPSKGKYTINRFLDDLERRYGGVDCVIIWHNYPTIGIDDRNQIDLIRDLPGGIPALKKVVEEAHQRGVAVIFPTIPWDRGTREEGVSDWIALTKILSEIGADGIYGDTYNALPYIWRKTSENIGHPLVLQPQNALMDEALGWNTMAHGDEWQISFIPTVSHHKWLEPRHMIQLISRWAHDRTDYLQLAFFNGIGYYSWENIWGIWNGIIPRDAEAIRRLAKIERFFSNLLISPEWEPHSPTLQYGVFSSKFPGKDCILWTIINRNNFNLTGPQLRTPRKKGTRFYNVWNGKEIIPENGESFSILSFDLEARGYGAILSVQEDPVTERLRLFLEEMRAMGERSLSTYSDEWHFLAQKLVEIQPTDPAVVPPNNMILIPGGDFNFKVSGIEIEGENRVGVGIQYPWENSPRRHHKKRLQVKSFYIDKYLVSNADFKRFLDATKYKPKDDHNFLRHWRNGTYPKAWAKKPVIWVSIEDARAYAAWEGKRLPHEWEWQYAAQGNDGRLYPWGNSWNSSAVPKPEKGREMDQPSDCGQFEEGNSPFGVMDMIGNVWQWTDEYQDKHTRFAVLRGGSYYQPQGSKWYFPQAYRLDQHGKYLLMAPSRDRSASVGFRCVKDIK
jgi:iron(II)-dependent oxidoreductase